MTAKQLAFRVRDLIGVASARLLGRTAAGTGRAEELTAEQVRTLLSVSTISEIAASYQPIGDYATLVSGLVPAGQLPSYVDDVIEGANLAAFPVTGESGKIYVALDTSRTYRWSGSAYVELTDSTAVWGSISGTLSNQTDLQNALDGKAASSHSHIVDDVTGLQTAIDGKQATLVSGTNLKTVNSTSLLGSGDIAVGVTGTGSTDNAILRANGTGGSALQSSGATISDDGLLTTRSVFVGATPTYVTDLSARQLVAHSETAVGTIVASNFGLNVGTNGISAALELYGWRNTNNSHRLRARIGGGQGSNSNLGILIVGVDTNGSLVDRFYVTTTGASVNAIPTAGQSFSVISLAATDVVSCFKGAASQTANLTEWQNSAGTVIASVTAAGAIEVAPNGAGYAMQGGWGSFRGSSPLTGLQIVSAASFTVQPAAGSVFAIINSTNAQTSRLYNTYTSATSFENLQFKANAGAAYQIGSAVGSAGGTTRGLDLGRWDAAGTFSPWLSFANTGAATLNADFSCRDITVRNLRMSAPTLVPASASATGAEGQIAWDANYIYICIATNTWKRTAIATW